MINHPVVSMYTRSEMGNSSTIKFGSWDQSGLENGEMKMYQLGRGELSLMDLGLPTRNISQGGLYYQHEPHKIYFNPSVPYVYLNHKDYTKMVANFA
jgi:hypothetical protein